MGPKRGGGTFGAWIRSRALDKAHKMREGSERLGPKTVEAMAAVLAGVPATEAWVDYVRHLYPEILEGLARIAVSDIAIDLLRDNGDLPAEEAERQRKEAADAVAAQMPFFAWEEIHTLRSTLEALEAYARQPSRADVLELGASSAHPRLRAS
jgi:hypothetical protein